MINNKKILNNSKTRIRMYVELTICEQFVYVCRLNFNLNLFSIFKKYRGTIYNYTILKDKRD